MCTAGEELTTDGCESECDDEYDDDCIKSWGQCVRRANRANVSVHACTVLHIASIAAVSYCKSPYTIVLSPNHTHTHTTQFVRPTDAASMNCAPHPCM